jgi:hypothetical protein
LFLVPDGGLLMLVANYGVRGRMVDDFSANKKTNRSISFYPKYKAALRNQ